MKSYIPVKSSQVYHYVKTPLYKKGRGGGYILFKADGLKIDSDRYTKEDFPQLYILRETKETASEEIRNKLKKGLIKNIQDGNLKSIKSALCDIVQEAMLNPLGDNLLAFPETIDIMYEGFSSATQLLKKFSKIDHGGISLIEHSVNVMLFTLNYCFFVDFTEKKTKKLSLAALLHDVGLTQIPSNITTADRRLTDTEFAVYKTHPTIGGDIIKENRHISTSIAAGVLEHHEHINGKGYPNGLNDISFDGRLIGLIDSFDNLISSEKAHRRKKGPFDALKVIQNEVLAEEKFDEKIFKNLLMSLSGKTGLS